MSGPGAPPLAQSTAQAPGPGPGLGRARPAPAFAAACRGARRRLVAWGERPRTRRPAWPGRRRAWSRPGPPAAEPVGSDWTGRAQPLFCADCNHDGSVRMKSIAAAAGRRCARNRADCGGRGPNRIRVAQARPGREQTERALGGSPCAPDACAPGRGATGRGALGPGPSAAATAQLACRRRTTDLSNARRARRPGERARVHR